MVDLTCQRIGSRMQGKGEGRGEGRERCGLHGAKGERQEASVSGLQRY